MLANEVLAPMQCIGCEGVRVWLAARRVTQWKVCLERRFLDSAGYEDINRQLAMSQVRPPHRKPVPSVLFSAPLHTQSSRNVSLAPQPEALMPEAAHMREG